MKIAFFTEGNYQGKLDRTNPNGFRTDGAWIVALKADHYHLYSNPEQNYDLGIVIIPKKCEDGNFDISLWKKVQFQKIKNKCNKIAWMQEGPATLFQDLRVSTQIEWLDFLDQCDLLFCHNEIDQVYFQGLFPSHKVEILPPLMIEDSIQISRENRSGSIINGNMVQWYGAMDSYVVARDLGEEIYAPSMGRKQEEESLIEDINYLPYLNWTQWIFEMSKRKYAVNLMRTFAAGTFSLNAAHLGLPCIGWRNGIDSQQLCFPELSVSIGDMVQARKVAKHLRENELFYNHCSTYAKKMYREIYSEQIFIEKFMENVNGI